MPIPVDTLPSYRPVVQIECMVPSDRNGSKSYSEITFGRNYSNQNSSTVLNYDQFNNNKTYLKLVSKIKNQLKVKSKLYIDLPSSFVEQEFAVCTNDLLELQPDLISVELTSESSLFYTVRKNSFTLFFQYFLSENKFDKSEEALLSMFYNDDKLTSKEGDRLSVIAYAKDLVSS